MACKIFIGGGGDDWFNHIVKNYKDEYAAKNPTVTCHYFSWTDPDDVGWTMRLVPKHTHLTVIGHSYGADCAFGALRWCNRGVNTLISIDPVGRLRPSWVGIRARCARWLNVRAEASERNWGWRSDGIAAVGGQYPRPPLPGQAGAPDHSLVMDATHADFRGMMRGATREGVSGRSLLGGIGVA
jgi:hypothetical protein